MHDNRLRRRQTLALLPVALMYKLSDAACNQLALFEKSMPFGGKLAPENRWIRLTALVDWQTLEIAYAKNFAETGRPGLSARLVIGALIVKHKLQISDEEALQQIIENPYLQYFIGLERFATAPPFASSTLTHVRKRLGEDAFAAFEEMLVNTLIARKLIKTRGLHVDATAFESEITFPTDTRLLNKAREFCVKQIDKLGKAVGQKVRTYRRVAQKEYLAFNKKRRKTKKQIRLMKKHLLQYLRRNVRQLSELLEQAQAAGGVVAEKVKERFETVKTIYDQQKEMYDEKKHTVKNRVVSLHKDYVRPIVRGKCGKNVEFGAKVNLSHVNGFMFADYLSFDNFNESLWLKHAVEAFKKRFDRLPDYVCVDHIFGTRENRAYLKEQGIRTTVKPLGRKKKHPRRTPNCDGDSENRRNAIRSKAVSDIAKKTIILEAYAPNCPKPSRRGSEWGCSPAI